MHTQYQWCILDLRFGLTLSLKHVYTTTDVFVWPDATCIHSYLCILDLKFGLTLSLKHAYTINGDLRFSLTLSLKHAYTILMVDFRLKVRPDAKSKTYLFGLLLNLKHYTQLLMYFRWPDTTCKSKRCILDLRFGLTLNLKHGSTIKCLAWH